MKFIILAILIISNAVAVDKYICSGSSIDLDPRISVDKILLDFPQAELYVEHRDMRLEVVDFYTDYNPTPMHWWEENPEYFVYTRGEQKISFAWGTQHYGELYLDKNGKSFSGEITLSKAYTFKVDCRPINL